MATLQYQAQVSRPNSTDIIWINIPEPIVKDNIYIRSIEVDNNIIKDNSNIIIDNINIINEDNDNINSEIFNTINISSKFTTEQFNAIKVIINMINSNRKFISLTGGAGSGKSYTILNMFKYFNYLFKSYNIVFCAPTNIIVEKCKEFEHIIAPNFKSVEFLTISQLLGEVLKYDNEGNSKFVRKNGKIPLNNFEILIIDESSMIGNNKIQQIMEEYTNGIVIFIGDKNQLNPVNELENSILSNPHINLSTNMRCNKKLLNKIFNKIIDEITLFNNTPKYNKNSFNKFIFNLTEYLNKKQNNKTLLYFNNKEQFLNQYINDYNNKECIICNYTNKECDNVNTYIKNYIVKKDNIQLIDDTYYINQQLIFNKRYNSTGIKFNKSELIKIKNITEYEYNLTMVSLNNLYIIIKETNNMTEEEFHTNIERYKIHNELLFIFKLFNKIREVKSYKINVINKKVEKLILTDNNFESNIYVLNKCENTKYYKYIENIRHTINSLSKYKNIFITEIISNNLYKLLDNFRINIFASIKDGFACTAHLIQGCSINTIYVNLSDLLVMSDTELKNKLKIIYTACTRCSKTLVVYYK